MGDTFCKVRPKGQAFWLEVPERNRDWYEIRGYENYTATLFSQVMHNADLFIDVGSHVGFYAKLARAVNPKAKIIAAEPLPLNIEVLHRNLNGLLVEIVEKPIGTGSNSNQLYISKYSDNGRMSVPDHDSSGEVLDIDWVSGAVLIKFSSEKIVLKIDVEGFEKDVLESFGMDLLSKLKVKIFLEINPKSIYSAGQSVADLVNLLHKFSYRTFVLDDDKYLWAEIHHASEWNKYISLDGYGNLYCVHKDDTLTVATVLHSSGSGGVEQCQIELADELIKRGALLHTFIPQDIEELKTALQTIGSSVGTYKNSNWWANPASHLENERFELDDYLDQTLLEETKALNPDVIHTQTGVIPQGSITAAMLGKPHIWSIHEFLDKDHGLSFPKSHDFFSTYIQEMSDSIICNSKSVLSYHFGNNSEHSVIYPNPNVGNPFQIKGSITMNYTVGIIGNHNPGKGHVDLIEAVRLLKKEKFYVQVRIIGAPSEPNTSFLKSLIKEYQIHDRIEFIQNLTDKNSIYEELDCVVICSRNEAFGRVPFEANHFQLPLIYTLAGGLTEYLEDGKSGLGYHPGDSATLKECIKKLALDTNLKDNIVFGARERFAVFQRTNDSGNRLLGNFRKAMTDYQQIDFSGVEKRLNYVYS